MNDLPVMRTTLFIGNGLNRCKNIGGSWGDLLQAIANEYNVDYCSQNPMPIEFERIANKILLNSTQPSIALYDKLKIKISDNLKDAFLPTDAIHKKFMRLPISNVITTNYDYMLEKAHMENYETVAQRTNQETKYSVFRKIDINGRKFYHMHGEASEPKSICLGYEHYAGYLARIRSTIHLRNKDKKKETLRIKEILLGNEEYTNCWAELFFTDNIYIIGFGFDQSEIDLWWVLTYRAFLFYSNDCGIKNLINNKIVYYSIDEKIDENKRNIFTNMNVEYVSIQLMHGDYIRAYNDICADINLRDRRTNQ